MMAAMRDFWIMAVLIMVATVIFVFMFEPKLIGESLRAIDDARFLNVELDEGLPLE